MDNRPDGVAPASLEAARSLAPRLSAAHRREIAVTSGLSPVRALELSLAASAEAYALTDGRSGEVVFMMGVEPASPITGGAMVWMLGGAGIRRRPARTLRCARWGIERAFAATGAEWLEQYIPEWYRAGQAFARRLGFVVERETTRGSGGCALRRVVLHRTALKTKG